MSQLTQNKIVLVDRRAGKEIKKLARPVQLKFQALFEILEEKGKLEEPFGKKLNGQETLFEIRVRYQSQWRALYAYIEKNLVVILSVFAKKTPKTPKEELKKAISRLNEYKE